jgi:hypothetical protein
LRSFVDDLIDDETFERRAELFRFAPRYRNVQRQVKRGLVGFRHPTHCDKDWPVRPNRRVREGLILAEEANIERIPISLALKTTTQNVIAGHSSPTDARTV